MTGRRDSGSMGPDPVPEKPFTCPHCRHTCNEIHHSCPKCGRPFIRDYIDWRMHPRDPELRVTLYYNAFRARVLLVLTAPGLVVTVLVVVAGCIR